MVVETLTSTITSGNHQNDSINRVVELYGSPSITSNWLFLTFTENSPPIYISCRLWQNSARESFPVPRSHPVGQRKLPPCSVDICSRKVLTKMAKCAHCGKTTSFGRNVPKSMHSTRREFKANLQKVRLEENGRRVHKTLCTKCIKALAKLQSLCQTGKSPCKSPTLIG